MDKAFHLELDPVPAPRPRVTRAGFAYYPKAYNAFRKEAHAQVTNKWTLGVIPKSHSDLTVIIHIHCRKPRTSKLATPRGDCDNYAKSVLDAMNKVVYEDDTQVQYLEVAKFWTTGDPFIAVRVRDTEAS
jgi:Holliday junction resolvase RusA-like endonuclease